MSTEYFSSIGTPMVYAYSEPQYLDVPWQGQKQGKGLLKIGYTTRDVEARVAEQFPIKKPGGKPYVILVAERAIAANGEFFTDKKIHAILKEKGFRNVNGEWYEATTSDVMEALHEARQGYRVSEGRQHSFPMRPEQQKAVEVTKAYFKRYENTSDTRSSHFLWNAKMRFGKTFTAYQLAKAMGWKRVLVLTYKPAVEDAWRSDLNSHVDFSSWQFIGRGESFEIIDETKPYVWFASFQDILGKTKSGGIKERFEAAHVIDWDAVILDEYHFGAWRNSAKELYDADTVENEKELKAQEEFSEETFPLSVRHFLYMTGTPFRALNTGEFLEDQIFNWTYPDEQRAKEQWIESNGVNPYDELPQIVMMTYQMPEAIRAAALKSDNNEFDLNEFFKAKEVPSNEPSQPSQFIFEHEKEVQMWLHLIRGNYMPANPQAGTDGKKPPIPYEDIRLQKYLIHTFWFLPSVASCKAMARLLGEVQNNFFNDYKIIVAAGADAGIGLDAIAPVKEAMTGNPLTTKTITLSCGKLTTGVSIPAWTGIFMLRNTSSPETYFQAAFRVQTPWVLRNKLGTDPHSKEIVKAKCYIFDFAPNRALQLISEYSSRLDLNENTSVESKVADFLRFLPVLCYDGFSMQPLDARELLDIVASGTASTMLAKRWQSAQMVSVDNITLERLLNNPTLMAALEKIEAFRNLGKDLSKVISSEKALSKSKKERNEQGGTATVEEKNAEKENQGFKKLLREKLLKFVTRVPVFMYLTDYREEALKDVIMNIEPELFTKVTGLSVSDFEKLCELGVFNAQAMNSAIFAFKRFEEASLTYAGGAELSEYAGGWDQTIRRSDIPLVIEGIS